MSAAEARDGEIVSLSRFRKLKGAARKLLPDEVIEDWKCRVWTCLKYVGATETAREVLELFNRELARQRQKPIAEDEVMLCPECAVLEHERNRRW